MTASDAASTQLDEKSYLEKSISATSQTRDQTTVAAAPYPTAEPDATSKETLDHLPDNVSTSSSRPRSSSTASTLDPERGDTQPPLAHTSRVSTDAHGNTYPEGGVRAWLVVFGSFAGLFIVLGIMNTLGTYQAWFSKNQLKDYNAGQIGWIFGIYAFLSFFCGIQVGPLFDAKGPTGLVIAGSCVTFLHTMLLGECTKYWHFVLVFGVLGGIGTSLIFSPALGAIAHWFNTRRGLATGAAAAGGSLGGVIFPLMLEYLLPRYGFAWATRIVGFVQLGFLGLAILLIKSRLPPRKATKANILPDARIFRDPVFALTTAGIFFAEWGLFVPITYISAYAEHYYPHITHPEALDAKHLGYTVLIIMNAGSCLGRCLPGIVADKIGRFNCIIITSSICCLSSFIMWPFSNSSSGGIPTLIVYSILFGFASGSTISVTPVCVGQLCKTEHYGRYYATSYTIVSFAALTGVPIAGAIQASSPGGGYLGLIGFTGASYAAGMACYLGARIMKVGGKVKVKF